MLPHCKLCNLEDFADPGLGARIRELFPAEKGRFGDRFPRGREYRKYWEVAMSARALEELGALGDETRVLGVGAGHEATVYWLTRRAGRVVATDLYRDESEWVGDADLTMLENPGRYAAGHDWDPSRLDVRHMDALHLDFADESFDAIFSSSSIEHFGGHAEVRRSAKEMHRVLRPGGVAALSTEFRLEGPSPGPPGIVMLDAGELAELLVDGVGWEAVGEPDLSLTGATRMTALPHEDVDLHRLGHASAWDRYGGIPHFQRYPVIVLRDGPYLWTSVHMALRKP